MDPLSCVLDLALKTTRLALLPLGLLVHSAGAQAPLDVRVALVIGNAAYPASPLLNPVNDATAMAATLKGLGFSVIELKDAGRDGMKAAVERLSAELKGRQAVGMLYYAGHGLQVDWRNYMVPVDARIASGADVPTQAVDVSSVIDGFRAAGNRMNIVVLDACRDNPFATSASSKGLAPLDAPPGTFLAYATAPGNVAEDGDAGSGNGLYTRFLLQELRRPATRIEDVFKRVRLQVRQTSQGRQIPWESTSLEEDFVFNAGVRLTPPPEVAQRDQAFAEQKAAWDRIKDSARVEDVYEYLQRYPSGLVSGLAQARLDALQKAAVVAQTGRDGVRVAGGVNAIVGDRFEFVHRDGLTGIERARSSVVLRRVEGDLFEGQGTNIPSNLFNAAGFVHRDGVGTYDPPWNLLPDGEFGLGKRSSARSVLTLRSGQKIWVDVDTRIVAREVLELPIGRINAYRVQVRMVFQSGNISELTLWYDPEWSYSVRSETRVRNARGLVDFSVREMVSRTRGAG